MNYLFHVMIHGCVRRLLCCKIMQDLAAQVLAFGPLKHNIEMKPVN